MSDFKRKRGETLIFDGGSLTMRNGDGYFVFAEDAIEWESDDESSKVIIEVSGSGLIELRDFLTKALPPWFKPTPNEESET